MVHLQNALIYYVNCKKEEDGVNALMELIHVEGVTRLKVTEERNVNLSKRVTMEHCFKEEGKQEITKKGKHQDGFSVS